jgi:feruloyl esterase
MDLSGLSFKILSKLFAGSLFLPNRYEDHSATCLSLKSSLNLENTTITDVSYVPAGSQVPTRAGTDCWVTSADVNVPVCRVQFFTNTTDTSSIHAEAWLPDQWYGRFLGVGNGGLNGCKRPCIAPEPVF